MDTKQLRQKSIGFRREVVDKMSSLATAAFGLVAALAWNSAIQAIFARLYPVPGDAIWALVGYAGTVTIVAVMIILIIGRIAGKLKAEDDAEKAEKAAAG